MKALTLHENCDGVPQTHVPTDELWDLVEYLSYQRVATHFTFEGDGFTVSFPHQAVETVRQMLADWHAEVNRAHEACV